MFRASHWHGDWCNSWFPNDRVKWTWFRQSTFRSVKRRQGVVSHRGYRANWMDSGKKSHKYLIYSKLAFWSIRFITYLIYSEKFSSLFGLRMRMNRADEPPKPSKPLTEILGIFLHVFTAIYLSTNLNKWNIRSYIIAYQNITADAAFIFFNILFRLILVDYNGCVL